MWNLGAKIKEKHKIANSFKNAVIMYWVKWKTADSRMCSLSEVWWWDSSLFHIPKKQNSLRNDSAACCRQASEIHTYPFSWPLPLTRDCGINVSIWVWSRFSKSYVKFVWILFWFTYEKNIKGL